MGFRSGYRVFHPEIGSSPEFLILTIAYFKESKTDLNVKKERMPNRNVATHSQLSSFLPWFHGLYYLISGVWPLLNIESFQLVTGPKTDLWLVKTVGVLLMVTGFVLALAAYRRRVSLEIVVLAIGNAFALTMVELVYWSDGTISAVYLLDAVIEVVLIIGWLILWQRMRKIDIDNDRDSEKYA